MDLILNKTIAQLAMANYVYRYGHELSRVDGHFLRLRLKVNGRLGGRIVGLW